MQTDEGIKEGKAWQKNIFFYDDLQEMFLWIIMHIHCFMPARLECFPTIFSFGSDDWMMELPVWRENLKKILSNLIFEHFPMKLLLLLCPFGRLRGSSSFSLSFIFV